MIVVLLIAAYFVAVAVGAEVWRRRAEPMPTIRQLTWQDVAMAKLREELGSFQRAIGEAMMPAMQSATESLERFVAAFDELLVPTT